MKRGPRGDLKKKEPNPGGGSDLRKRAEKKAGAVASESVESLTPEQVQRTLHELRVHQIELEMQNEELRRAQVELETEHARYFDLYDLAPAGYCTLNEKNLILEANLTIADLLGEKRGALVKQPFSRFILPEDQDIYYTFCRRYPENITPHVCELRLKKKDNTTFWAQLSASIVHTADRSPVFRIVISDVSERRQFEDARTFLLECGYPGSNDDFFGSLARYLAKSLNMDYVCIDRLSGDALSAQTMAVYNNGNFDANVAYTLKDTPCGDVVGKAICCFPRNVRGLFPKDATLRQLEAESYIGTTLWSYDGKPIGLIAVIGRKPLTDTTFAESLLKLVAFRAAGEIERQLVEEKIRDIALFPEQNPSPVMRIESTGTLIYGNPASREFQDRWGFCVGNPVPREWNDLVQKSVVDRKTRIKEAAVGERIFAFTIVPLADLNYVNVYAFDITRRSHSEASLKNIKAGLEIQVRQRTADLQKTLETLTMERRRFNDVLEMLPAYIVLLTPDRGVKFANRFFTDRFGMSGSERFLENQSNRDGSDATHETARLFTADAPRHQEWTGPDGRNYDVHDFPFTDADGSPLIMEMGIDITDRKKAEAALIEANEMNLLGRLASGVAHEVRNPLNGILAIMGALSKELSDDGRFQPYLQHMRNQVSRLTVLMEDLLALGRPIREDNIHEVSMVALVEKAIATWLQTQQSPAKPPVRLIKPEPPERCVIKADGMYITQMIINLLENACNHSPSGTEFVCSVGSRPPGRVVFSVKDRGAGIAAEILPKIFDPFFTTRKGGTGLGLSIVRRIVENHRGNIVASNNTDGPGATFETTFPASGS